MAVAVVVLLLAAVVAAIAAFRYRARAQRSEQLLHSVEQVLGNESVERDLVGAVGSIVTSEADARKQATAYSTALQGTPTGVALLDENGSMLYANPAADMILDGGGERAVLRTRVTSLAQRVSSAGSTESVEVDLHDPDLQVLSLTAVPIPSSNTGAPLIALYIEDLSERKRVDMLRTDFVANASHELKTPLGALSLLAETLADVTDEADRIRLSERLQAEATRMANVVDDVLQLAETESLGPDYVHVAIPEAVGQAAKDVVALAEGAGLALIEDEVADVVVAGDRELIVSAVRNLLHNAITYTAIKGGPGVVTYRARRDGDMVAIEVEDTGIGIPVRYTDRVFERFFRVDRARSRESGGTGLGLSIVRNVALAHGGHVTLRSEVGVGSTFGIHLPVADEG